MSVGANIKKRRFELGLSQQELADAMGYKTRSTIAKIESGENDVSQKKLQKFAIFLDTTVESLISGSDYASLNTSRIGSVTSDEPFHRNKNVAIILAGGKSIRNHQNIPNQFINILGKPVVVYCLEAYQRHPAIDDIYVVCLKGWESIVTTYARQYQVSKLRGIIPGGGTGILSVMNGFNFLCDKYSENDIVIFQEATRPMVSVDMISKLLQSCSDKGTATICQSMKDYVQFTVNGEKSAYIDRNSIVDLQSPEAHTLARIKTVFSEAQIQQHALTESCCTMLMYTLGFDINFIEGSVNNIKIVRQEDISVVTTLLKQME